ncbi:MAG TPA: methyltransferase domain-containing protein [Solirubrobacteraceae bacterium]|jgi:SAM-dependent methyltransferase|nr:methyltransferase domain-containing protein [Solirubrobacteraceae bacterium]
MTPQPEPTATAERHYTTGLTRESIDRALREAGKDPQQLSPVDLAPLEDFHSLGRLATLELIHLAEVGAQDRVLDAGTGIGGAARLLAAEVGCRVIGVDLTAEYCETAEWLNAAVGLGSGIEIRRADVTELPFADGAFDVVISQHVQMNVADKSRLYAEARRVLDPGGRLALWDVTAGPVEPIRFPVPWATDPADSHLITPAALREVTTRAGFEVTAWNDLTGTAAEAMRAFFDAPANPLGLHVFVPDFATKAANLIANAEQDRVRLIQAVLIAK